MKISRDTKERIITLKADANSQKNALINYLARLSEHPGTKKVCRDLEKVIIKLETWQNTPHV